MSAEPDPFADSDIPDIAEITPHPDLANTAHTNGYCLESPAWVDYPPHFKGWRPGQEEAVDEIVQAYYDGYRTVLVDAPTGAGKTWIGAGVRAKLGVQATYSCHSLNLQDQWAGDFAPYPVLKGRSNYPIEGPMVPRWTTAADCTWDASNPENGCHWCPEKVACPYEVAKRRALAASFRCVNHSYLITESRFIGRFKHPLLIIDEAEMLEDAILQQVSVTFPKKLREDLRLGQPEFVTKEDSIREWLEFVVIPALSRDAKQYPRDSTDRRIIRLRDAAINRLDQTRFVFASYGSGWVFDRSGDNWAMRPVWASHWGKQWIGGTEDKPRAERVLAMSATLISGVQVAEDLGLPEPHYTVRVEGGFLPDLRPVYIAPAADLRAKAEYEGAKKFVPPAEYDKTAMALRAIMARHPRDRILVHTHSYKIADELHQRVGTSPRVLTYTGGGRDKALEQYLAEPASVLLAPSLERGVNLPDDKCRVVVWAKVPFPNLGDPVVQRRTYSGGPHGRRWYAVETIRAVVQGCGRAVRHAEDWAENYIIDAAFLSLWRKENRLFPGWFKAAVKMNFNTRALMLEGEQLARIHVMARNARAKAGLPEPKPRQAVAGDRPWKRGRDSDGHSSSTPSQFQTRARQIAADAEARERKKKADRPTLFDFDDSDVADPAPNRPDNGSA